MTQPDKPFPAPSDALDPDEMRQLKAACRSGALARRAALAASARIEGSLALADHAAALAFPGGAVVSGFWPIRDEIDPRPLMDALRVRGHPLCLPAMVGEDLVFRRLTRDTPLVRGGFGTVEPAAEAEEVVPDCLLVPLAAFDRRGARIGYGRGFYDRAIARITDRRGTAPETVGLAFSVQQASAVPEEGHDRRLERVLTEAGLITCGVAA
ncbi:5-formyltetrahydrofolate cyclo-ligase [Stappia indica]|uniref:5-formyltetrahydrofolate cyclo-ligase n=1 Tax=Stappia indica TaxID=538381 RepID=UPI001CD24326|nr:5-formyltetrahydrofolate cyclo-ligase [Stappia indica]MCA1298229.1 5-formyltetrahydrofolate cyclo-ligase [Stappia indica]